MARGIGSGLSSGQFRMEGDLHAICTYSAPLLHVRALRCCMTGAKAGIESGTWARRGKPVSLLTSGAI
jgi:hypothetical protein